MYLLRMLQYLGPINTPSTSNSTDWPITEICRPNKSLKFGFINTVYQSLTDKLSES